MAQAQQLNNYAQTTLASGCTNVAVTLSVVSVAGWPTVGNFMLRIDDAAPATTFEYVEVTSVNVGANQVTVTRAQEGTTGIAHLAGAFVGNDLTAAMLGRYVPWGMQLYKARAYRNAAVSHTATGTWQKIVLDTIVDDPNGNFSTVTGLYTVPAAGWYMIGGALQFAIGVTRIGCMYSKNAEGAPGRGYTLILNSNAAGLVVPGVASICKLAAGDTIGLYGYQDSAGNLAYSVGADGQCWMSIHYLSAP